MPSDTPNDTSNDITVFLPLSAGEERRVLISDNAMFFLASVGEVFAGEYFNEKRGKYVGIILGGGTSDSLPDILFTTYAQFTEPGTALDEMNLIIERARKDYKEIKDVLLDPAQA